MKRKKQIVKPVKPTGDVYLIFPDELASVRILEILHPFSAKQREMILGVVDANIGNYPRAETREPGIAHKHFRKVSLAPERKSK